MNCIFDKNVEPDMMHEIFTMLRCAKKQLKNLEIRSKFRFKLPKKNNNKYSKVTHIIKRAKKPLLIGTIVISQLTACVPQVELDAKGLYEDVDIVKEYNNPQIQVKERNKDEVIIAVIDSGVSKNMLKSEKKILNTDIDNIDYIGHGTGVTDIILKKASKYPKYGSKIRILPIKMSEITFDELEFAVKYAVDSGAQVINLSMGFNDIQEYEFNRMKNIFDYAHKNNVIVVAAAGKKGDYGEDWPAIFPRVISIGSVDKDNNSVSFSNYGDYIDFVSYGKDINVEGLNGINIKVSGNSFASPDIAADVGLYIVKLKQEDVNLTFEQIYEALVKSSIDVEKDGKEAKTGWGLIDTNKLLNMPLQEGKDMEGPNIGMFNTVYENSETKLTFRVLDLSKINTTNMKVTISEVLYDGTSVNEREIDYLRSGDKFMAILSDLPDGKYVVNIKNVIDVHGNVSLGTKRYFFKDRTPVDVRMTHEIIKKSNGYSNKAIFSIDVKDNFEVNLVEVYFGDEHDVLFEKQTQSKNKYIIKNLSLKYELMSQNLQDGVNIITFTFSDGKYNYTHKYFKVVMEKHNIVSVEEVSEEFLKLNNFEYTKILI